LRHDLRDLQQPQGLGAHPDGLPSLSNACLGCGADGRSNCCTASAAIRPAGRS
jgi:hypothetical protein